MDPITGTIVTMLAKEGFNIISGLIKGGGKEAVKVIERKTGIDLKDIVDPNTKTILSPEQKVTLAKVESDDMMELVEIVANADVDKAPGIIVAAIAPEIPELVLFGMGLVLVFGFALTDKPDVAAQLGSAWLGAFAMYVKGK